MRRFSTHLLKNPFQTEHRQLFFLRAFRSQVACMQLSRLRAYGLGACVATQRIAYLNTNALQQLHTYFVGTLPTPYDRTVVSNTFMIDQGTLEKTLEFTPGEWLLSSYIATGIENVPIFIRADNAGNELEKFLSRTISHQGI